MCNTRYLNVGVRNCNRGCIERSLFVPAHCLVIGHFEFRLDCAETTFHECIVVAIACTTHALKSLGATQNGSIFVAGILASAIAVMNQSRRWLSLLHSQSQSSQYERLSHIIGQMPAHNASREKIQQDCEVTEGSVVQRNVSDVTDPDFIELRWRVRFKQQVWRIA